MKFEIINRRFTETVSEWLTKGYTINTASMCGSQGEIGKIDLTDGKEVIRILLDTFTMHSARNSEKWYSLEGVKLIVGRVTDPVVPNSEDTWNHIWNNHLEVLSCEEYYQIGRAHRDNSKWYGTEAEAIAQQDKSHSRYRARWTSINQTLSDEAAVIVLPFIRRQPKCKRAKACDIESVIKRTSDSGKNSYYVKFRGKELRLK